MLELTLRLVCSLAVVVGLLLLLAKFGQRRFRGNTNALVQVVHRQALSRTSAVAVVTVGSRVLVLGTTEQQVRVLAELDPEELVDAASLEALEASDLAVSPGPPVSPEPLTAVPSAPVEIGTHRRAVRETSLDLPTGLSPVAGSVLSPATWRQALAAVSSVTSRRSS